MRSPATPVLEADTMKPGNVGEGIVRTWEAGPERAPRSVATFALLPSRPVPDMTTTNGAGLCCAENQTRNRRSNQKTSGSGCAQGSAILISTSGTLRGIGAAFSGDEPNTVARSPAESARPVAGPGAGGAGIG